MYCILAGLEKVKMGVFNLIKDFSFSFDEIMFNKLLLSLLWVISIILISFIAKKIANHKITDIKSIYLVKKAISYISMLLTIILLLIIWFRDISNLSTIIGLASAGFAIALKDIISDLAGWTYIITKKPFTTGDRVEVGDLRGDIVDIGFLKFSMLEIGNWVDSDQSTGRIIFIPNSYIYLRTFVNYTKDFNFIWNEIPVVITFESDWKKAKSILEHIINKDVCETVEAANIELENAAKKQYIFFTKLTPIVWVSAKENGVVLTIRYLCRPRKRRGSEDKIWTDILSEFSRHEDINFAHQTTRLYFQENPSNEIKITKMDK